MLQQLNAISTRDVFTLWWNTRWIRFLVLSLIPVGIVDAAFTLAAISMYGVEIEINPFVRTIISSGHWLAWALINITAFSLFCMLTGSYYLHTRSRTKGPDAFWLSFVIALRVGMVVYNITFMYLPFLEGGMNPPFWTFFASIIITFTTMNWLLKRKTDISIAGTKKYFRYRLDRIHDRRLLRSVRTDMKPDEPQITSIEESMPPVKRTIRSRIGRGMYLILAIVSFGAMFVALDLILRFSGWMGWESDYGNYLVFKPETALGFVMSFGVIIFFLGLTMGFIYKAFDSSDDIVF
ncbi:MAG: hypothetical protein RTV72_08115 [Candidatus Thorarchaeota archaeon]